MTDKPRYHDKRASFWREHLELALPYEEYLERSDPNHAAKWTRMAAALPALTEEQAARLRSFGRRLDVLVYSGVWCGDCVRQGPMIERIAAAAGPEVAGASSPEIAGASGPEIAGASGPEIAGASGPEIAVRFIERDVSEELQDELRVLGALRVPVVVFLSEDMHEIGRFGDRLLTAYCRKAERETGAACDAGLLPPSGEELVAEQGEWIDVFERMLLMLRLAPPLRARYGD